MRPRSEERRFRNVLCAIATTERVATALQLYDERDHAIEVLEDDIAVQRHQLVLELRSLVRPHARAALTGRDLRPHWS